MSSRRHPPTTSLILPKKVLPTTTTALAKAPPRLPHLAPLLALVLLVLHPTSTAASCDPAALYDLTYAMQAAGKGAAEVRAWLHGRVSAHHSPKSYAQAYDILEAIDQHNASHVRVIYGGTDAKCQTGEFAGRACAWNREHLWPQSYGVGKVLGYHLGWMSWFPLFTSRYFVVQVVKTHYSADDSPEYLHV
jgi:hypothetical protein